MQSLRSRSWLKPSLPNNLSCFMKDVKVVSDKDRQCSRLKETKGTTNAHVIPDQRGDNSGTIGESLNTSCRLCNSSVTARYVRLWKKLISGGRVYQAFSTIFFCNTFIGPRLFQGEERKQTLKWDF